MGMHREVKLAVHNHLGQMWEQGEPAVARVVSTLLPPFLSLSAQALQGKDDHSAMSRGQQGLKQSTQDRRVTGGHYFSAPNPHQESGAVRESKRVPELTQTSGWLLWAVTALLPPTVTKSGQEPGRRAQPGASHSLFCSCPVLSPAPSSSLVKRQSEALTLISVNTIGVKPGN